MLAVWIQTLCSFRAYRRLAAASAGRSLLFGVYLLLVGVLIFNVYFTCQLNKNLQPFLKSVPELTFEKGTLTAPQTRTSVHVPKLEADIVFAPTTAQPPSQQDFINNKWLAFISGNKIYMLSATGVQSQILPENLSGTLTQQTLQEYAPAMRSVLQTAVFLASFFTIGLFLIFSFILASSVAFLWRGLTRMPVPTSTLWRWGVFLQGPALVLWLVNLFFGVPLFLLALFILFNIYIQQIFNTVLYEQER